MTARLQDNEKGESRKSASSVLRRIGRKLLLVATLAVMGLFGLSMTSQKPVDLGVTDGRLAKCPESANCVSTQTETDMHKMPAIEFNGSETEAIAKIKQLVAKKFARGKLVEENNTYLRFEFTSLVFRFVDDVEFLVDDKENKIHFRSASRVGYSDLGANRRRMNRISKEFNK